MDALTQQILEFPDIIEYLSQLTYSPLGNVHLESLCAVTDFDTIERWLSEVSEVKEIRALHGHLPLDGLHDIRQLLLRANIEGAMLLPLEFRAIYDTLRAGRATKKFMAAIEPPMYQHILEKVERIVILDKVEAAIRQAIDEDGEILDGASQALKRIRKELRLSRDKIQNWLQNFLQRSDHQSAIQDQVITLRKNRYVIPVKASSKGQIKGIVHDQSASGITLFVEPLETVDLNNQIASLEIQEKQEIEKILLGLTEIVREHAAQIEQTTLILGELDFINAKARLSEKWQCCQPKLCRDRCISLLKSRHPLLLMQYEKNIEQVVPIDMRLDENYTTLLITGPNTGGKTVSLKTVGLLTLMVQAGLHIPVDVNSEICVFENIFADIGDQQSIAQNLSTFSSHISHIIEILKYADQRSLVLLDELGAGTDPAEGAALGIAILEYLDRVNATCIATTHHDALKSYAYTHPRTMNACVEFDVNTLSPTYRLLFGLPGKSNAFIIAERLGLPTHLIIRARELMGEDLLQVDHLIQKLTKETEDIDKQKQEIDARYRGVLRLEKETNRLVNQAEQERQAILTKALGDAKQIVEQAIRQAQDVLAKLPSSAREDRKVLVKTLRQEATAVTQKLQQAQKPVEPRAPAIPGEVVKGGRVRLSGFDQTGIVLDISNDGKKAEVQVGLMKVEMPVNQLIPIGLPERESKAPTISISEDLRAFRDDNAPIMREIVLVGKRIEEALEEAEKYLDQAFLSGLTSVSIVHGIGTGKLKNAVSGLLRSHPHVVRFATDEHNYGVTIVELQRK